MENDQITTEEVEEVEVTEQESQEEVSSDDSNEELERLRKENKTLQAQKAHWRDKAKKAEEVEQPTTEQNKTDELSSHDMYALMKADVDEDDFDEVIKASRLLGVSVKDALKDDFTQTLLKNRTEKRKTAQATNAGTARPANKAVSGDKLMQDLSQGKVPKAGTPEAEELFYARRGGRPTN